MTRAGAAIGSHADARAPELVIDPPGDRWPALLGAPARHTDDRARRMREQLALPTDRPIVMTGHQAWIWHPGILAKYLACDAAAGALRAAPAWVVVDQDEHDLAVRIPVRDASCALRAETASLAPPTQPRGAPTGALPAFEPIPPRPAGAVALPSVERGIARLVEALSAHRRATTAAAQVAGALADLMRPVVPTAPTVFATSLVSSDLFNELVDRMAADPRRVAQAYNDAVRAWPQAGVTELAHPDNAYRCELPLWRLRPGAPRLPVRAADLAGVPRTELAPKALLLTAILRLGACDLFIHGTGGGVYDRATDAWIESWLGERLAPVAVVTATMQLPLATDETTEADVATLTWRAHHALHDPAALHAADFARRKREHLARISALKTTRADPAPEFRALHALLESYRGVHAEGLARLRADAERARVALAESAVARDRTWPFPWHDDRALAALRDSVAHRFT